MSNTYTVRKGELPKRIRKCFTDTQMEHDDELTLFDTEQTIDNLLDLMSEYGDARFREGQIDELSMFEPFFNGDHSKCLDTRGCIGYQNAQSDYNNEREIRLEVLRGSAPIEAIETIATYNVTKVGEKLFAVDGLDNIKTLDGTVVKMNPESNLITNTTEEG